MLSNNKPYIAVAPMMDWTDRHCRYFMRLLAPNIELYTEMVTTDAILHGDRDRLLAYDAAEHPLVLQLGGSDPTSLAQCAKIAEDYQYDAVNLNVGCPSDRVQRGKIGACLMLEPELVAESVAAMRDTVHMPVTVKTRIGVDECDSYEQLKHFVQCIADVGCEHVILHARKAWLKGLSPKQNREVPPIRYDVVNKIKQDFPQLKITINGEIKTVDQAKTLLDHVDGVMIGREAYHNPFLLAELQQTFYTPDDNALTRQAVIERFIPYMQTQLDRGVYLKHMTRHILGLFQGLPGARAWRRKLSEGAHLPGADVTLLLNAMNCLTDTCSGRS
ncbi:MAG: tRNA-dihydrouridine(20/20a) synthase [marine bacterium B5-7]|nr:MAG: tRNA-dihydrouridine(20/20a) synthase [marine bacterium B5-7]